MHAPLDDHRSKILVRVRRACPREQRDRREAGEPDERRDRVALVLADQRGRERQEGDSTSTSSVIAIAETASLKFAARSSSIPAPRW
jgi:hypothetical protein